MIRIGLSKTAKKNCFSYVSILLICLGCSNQPNVEGLWELQKVDVDMIPRSFKPTYLKFDKDGSFSVSKVDGDLVGLYEINNSSIILSSIDQSWFNTKWEVKVFKDELIFNDVENGYRGEQLRFKKIEKFPDFEEFLQELTGNWKLYAFKEKGTTKKVDNTFLIIDENNYSIKEGSSVIEQGRVLIDTRHKKISFENTDIKWNATFVWNELRLHNYSADITYRLRKSD